MPRRRLLSPAAQAEVVRFVRNSGTKRSRASRRGGSLWGEQPSLREAARHLHEVGLVRSAPRACVIARALGYRYPAERRRGEA